MFVMMTKGPRSGRVLHMSQTWGETAVADEWARNLDNAETPWTLEGVDRNAVVPQSLTDYEAYLLTPEAMQPIGPEPEPEPSPTPVPQDPVPIVSLSNANPAIVTVASGDIGNFSNGMLVTVAATGTDADGPRTVGGLSGSTFALNGVNLTALEDPVEDTGTVQPPDKAPAAAKSTSKK